MFESVGVCVCACVRVRVCVCVSVCVCVCGGVGYVCGCECSFLQLFLFQFGIAQPAMLAAVRQSVGYQGCISSGISTFNPPMKKVPAPIPLSSFHTILRPPATTELN